MREPITIERHILEQQQRGFPKATGDFTQLLYDITFATKIISREVNKAGLVEILGATAKENVQGETVQKLDEYANDVIRQTMDKTGRVSVMASEEVEDVILVPQNYQTGRYVLLFDPLDGSSNIDANVSIGSIFSIHRKISEDGSGQREDCLQPGYRQVGAAYVIYGSSTMLVYTTGNGVHGFTLDPSVGEFLLSHRNIRIPKSGSIYSVNEGNYTHWEQGAQRFVDYLKSKDNHLGKPFSLRYIGSMVADLHRTLLYGGIFFYPRDQKDPDKPVGKLRLLYEASPMAFIFKHAGGYASDGEQDILTIHPSELHQRTPLIIGSKNDVKLAEEFFNGNRD
ncbi:fructose-bisphosphatase class I [candidate division KSB1 bacterium 4572_119]|nr:MAG: fructose-bisphosphatase class I [candidate division KSB1 bacterium 4572_119]